MSKRRSNVKNSFVAHPRYGALPHTSGLKVAEEDIRKGFWSLYRGEIYPESVLLSNTSLQNYSVFPRRYYVDARRDCRTCGRPFIFFAKEQRYWYETLRFFVDADCVYCPDCRRASRAIQQRMRRYSALMARQDLTAEELDELVADAVFLFTKGSLKNLSTLGALKNRAIKVIPHYSSTAALREVLARARSEELLSLKVVDEYEQDAEKFSGDLRQ